jgi:hypothetical protein
MQEEQFGPLVPIATWSSLQEVEDYVMSSHYGQQATTPASATHLATEHAARERVIMLVVPQLATALLLYCFSGADLAPRVVLVCAGCSVVLVCAGGTIVPQLATAFTALLF